MCRPISYSEMIITFILVFGHIVRISSESISSQAWSNIIQDLSLKIHDYKSDEKTVESHPLNEGFILFADSTKKPSTTTTSKPVRLSRNNRISLSHNISSTTCKTIIMVKTKNHTSPPIVKRSVGHLGRRLLNEPSYVTDIDTSSIQTTIEDDGEIDSFLKVDDEVLSKQLFNMQITTDGSGETTEETTEQILSTTTSSSTPLTTTSSSTPLTTTSSSTPLTTTSFSTPLMTTTTITTVTGPPIFSRNTTFILTIDCENATNTLNEILEALKRTFDPNHNVTYDRNQLQCNDSGPINVTLNIITDDNNITVLNELFERLKNISSSRNADLFSVDECPNSGIERVTNVTSCYLINLCHACGLNPSRGVCLPETGLSTCRCFVNENDPSRPYIGEFCWPKDPELIKPPSFPSHWTPIIVGILAGLTGLFCAITCCLWAVAIWRRIPNFAKDLRIRRLWHLPRAQIPKSVTNENVQNYLNNTISTLSSNQTDSDYNRSNTTDSTFFKELDQKMGENLRATITRPNTQAMLASLPSDTLSTLSSYDPIDELDSIIDNEDINMTFQDPLNELYEDNEILEVINPNLKLPRPNVDSKPTGLFSYF